LQIAAKPKATLTLLLFSSLHSVSHYHSTMPRVSSRRKSREVVDDDDEVEDQFIVKEEVPASARSARRTAAASQEEEEDEVEHILTYTQQCEPEKSQSFPVAKDSERQNLMEKMNQDQRQKIIVDTSRVVLFRALAGEPIDRLKCAKLAGFPTGSRITSAVWEQVQANLRNVFGFDLVKAPEYMVLPKKYSDRYFCINGVEEKEDGSHSKAIHSVHNDASMEKGILMVILAFCFCKGSPRPGSPATMRWITDIDLYRLLHGLDENLPQDPPSVTERKVHTTSQSNTIVDGTTPKVDVLMEKFVAMDYLLKDKMEDNTSETEDITVYAMGPRAALEVGRRQIIYFCSQILGEEPDPTMLQELDDGETQLTATQ
jgi:hypothetical protein